MNNNVNNTINLKWTGFIEEPVSETVETVIKNNSIRREILSHLTPAEIGKLASTSKSFRNDCYKVLANKISSGELLLTLPTKHYELIKNINKLSYSITNASVRMTALYPLESSLEYHHELPELDHLTLSTRQFSPLTIPTRPLNTLRLITEVNAHINKLFIQQNELEELTICHSPNSLLDYFNLPCFKDNIEKLKNLDLRFTDRTNKTINLDFFNSTKALTSFTCVGDRITFTHITPLLSLTQLTKLILYRNNQYNVVNDATANDIIHSLPLLRILDLSGNKITHLGIQDIGRLSLTSLFLSMNPIGNAGFASAANIPSLRYLSVAACNITSYEKKLNLPKLQVLDISLNKINNTFLQQIALLPQLKGIFLEAIELKENDLLPLTKAPKLNQLCLSHNNLRNSALEIVTTMTSLEKLTLDVTNLMRTQFPGVVLSDYDKSCFYTHSSRALIKLRCQMELQKHRNTLSLTTARLIGAMNNLKTIFISESQILGLKNCTDVIQSREDLVKLVGDPSKGKKRPAKDDNNTYDLKRKQ